ncbi:MAG: HU family DNA-binding protein [Sulfuricellaceae bacterium]
MTKQELIEKIRINAARKSARDENSITKKQAETWLDALCETLAEAMARHDETTLPGIGKLSIKVKPARKGRNPATGETLDLPAKTVPCFTAAKALKDAVNH